MTKFNKVNIEENWGYDDLYPFLHDAYRVLFISYQTLYSEKQKTPYTKPLNAKKWQLENLITDDLIRDEENLPKTFEYRIVNQQKDASKNTQIDIAIQWSLRFGHSYDIKIECKLLQKNNLDYYINGGIQKFKTNKYSEKLPVAGMLAYNTSYTISENIELLNTKIENKISKEEKLKSYSMLENYSYTYISNHLRDNDSDIDIYTMALDFKNVINK